ncbi:MAG: hypothetical protein FWD17_18965, partial [Polyangiaceae bacterium]|nr:hypothetical protein [Polyangiaceae bacterium]
RDCTSTTPTCLPNTHASACGACISDGTTEDCIPPTEGGCWVTGGGFIVDGDGHDSFGGNAKSMKDGSIQGEWEHVDHGTGDKLHGQPSYLVCRHIDEPGPGQPGGKKGFTDNQAYYGGPARWFDGTGWNDGYWFDVVVVDHGENKGAPPDSYQITVRLMSSGNASGTIVYQTGGDQSGGNIQLHPPNNGHPYTSSSVPSWVQLQP